MLLLAGRHVPETNCAIEGARGQPLAVGRERQGEDLTLMRRQPMEFLAAARVPDEHESLGGCGWRSQSGAILRQGERGQRESSACGELAEFASRGGIPDANCSIPG